MWTVGFWKGALERMLRAAAAALIGTFTADKTDALDHPDWRVYVTVALTAAIVSLLMSFTVNATGVGPAGSASAVYDRPVDPPNLPTGGSSSNTLR